jgi:hypothetical protein
MFIWLFLTKKVSDIREEDILVMERESFGKKCTTALFKAEQPTLYTRHQVPGVPSSPSPQN